jgi:hypothetical protein
MVHALEKIYRLLKPDGMLIDIHPLPEPPSIETRIGDRTIPAGWLKECNDYIEYEQADEALAQVVAGGLFAVERQGAFAFITHADTIAELREYLADEWQDASIDDITAMRAEEVLSTPARDKEVIVRESVRIARLRPIAEQPGFS